MFWLSALALGLAVLIFHFSRNWTDEVMHSTAALFGVICILFSLIVAPWMVQLPVAIALLSLPVTRYPKHRL